MGAFCCAVCSPRRSVAHAVGLPSAVLCDGRELDVAAQAGGRAPRRPLAVTAAGRPCL